MTNINNVTHAQAWVAYLNQLLEEGKNTIEALVETREVCSKELANHPTLIVSQSEVHKDKYVVGMLGVINGFLGLEQLHIAPPNREIVVAIFDEDGNLERFSVSTPKELNEELNKK